MVPEQSGSLGADQPESLRPPSGGRRGRRSGRGRRGRGRRPTRPPAGEDAAAEAVLAQQTRAEDLPEIQPGEGGALPESAPPEELLESVAETAVVPEEPAREPEPERAVRSGRETRHHHPVAPAPPPRAPAQPASPAAVQEAIEQVNQIIATLRETLEEMEEVLETLELAERQKTADEQEIESLRRSLRHLHGRPHEGGPPSHRGR